MTDDTSLQIFDTKGYRRNVGIVLLNQQGQVLIARRRGFADRWQFPQGGIHKNETILTSVYRELQEEVGLTRRYVELIASTTRWLRYRIPPKLSIPGKVGIGQTQRWFLMLFSGRECNIKLDNQGVDAEFDRHEWVDYWEPLNRIVRFKRFVYQNMLEQLHPHAVRTLNKL